MHTEHLMMKNKSINEPEQSTCLKKPLWHRWACLSAGPTQPIPHFVPAYKDWASGFPNSCMQNPNHTHTPHPPTPDTPSNRLKWPLLIGGIPALPLPLCTLPKSIKNLSNGLQPPSCLCGQWGWRVCGFCLSPRIFLATGDPIPSQSYIEH